MSSDIEALPNYTVLIGRDGDIGTRFAGFWWENVESVEVTHLCSAPPEPFIDTVSAGQSVTLTRGMETQYINDYYSATWPEHLPKPLIKVDERARNWQYWKVTPTYTVSREISDWDESQHDVRPVSASVIWKTSPKMRSVD